MRTAVLEWVQSPPRWKALPHLYPLWEPNKAGGTVSHCAPMRQSSGSGSGGGWAGKAHGELTSPVGARLLLPLGFPTQPEAPLAVLQRVQ